MTTTHREQYPEQYSDPLCGRRVRVVNPHNSEVKAEGIVERVYSTRYGVMVSIEGDPGRSWLRTWTQEVTTD